MHCTGTCTLENVWWEDVGEDAATLKGTSSSQVMTVNGGGARSASDKVFQHNGPGKFVIKNFQVSDFGKLYRSCGNCSKQYARTVVIDNIKVTAPGKSLVGINTNLGDKATITNVTIYNDSSHKIAICDRVQGRDLRRTDQDRLRTFLRLPVLDLLHHLQVTSRRRDRH